MTEKLNEKKETNNSDKEPAFYDFKNSKNLNFILYGPPGTGKTYEVLNLIDDLNEENQLNLEYDESKKLDANKNFWHLAPGYKAKLWSELKEKEYLGYEWCDKELNDLKMLKKSDDHYAIRKRFSEVKKGDYFCVISRKKFLGLAQALHDYDYEKAKNEPFEFQTIKVEWLERFNPPILLNSSLRMTFSHIGEKRWESLISGLQEKGFYLEEKEPEKKKIKKVYQFTTFHQSYSYEDFIEGIKPQLNDGNSDDEEASSEIEYEIASGIFYTACDKAAQFAGYDDLEAAIKDDKEKRATAFAKAQKYYFIIDEINRGNVANIFGELITLIEKDKRLGTENETIVSLPYSKTQFGVPSNLVIIGTMNTADRSIEALDSALRRRFSFIEKAPQTEELGVITVDKKEEIDLKKLLEAINNRIEILLDKDHLIGHSYFLNIKDFSELQNVFKNRIIPLLEEYFYGNPQMIGMILGSSFVKEKKEDVGFFSEFNEDYSNISQKKRYSIEIPEEGNAYRSIYGGN